MTTRVLAIASAIQGLLKAPAMSACPASAVYLNRDEPVPDAAAILIEIGDEPTPIIAGRMDRAVEIHLISQAKGGSAKAIAEAIHAEAYGRIMDDTTLGGLAYHIDEGDALRDHGVLDVPVCKITKTYIVRHLTERGSLS